LLLLLLLRRAGRYASGHAEGYVSVLNPDDLALLRQALATATPSITQACLLPRWVGVGALGTQSLQ
jgi:hypothetical protein